MKNSKKKMACFLYDSDEVRPYSKGLKECTKPWRLFEINNEFLYVMQSPPPLCRNLLSKRDKFRKKRRKKVTRQVIIFQEKTVSKKTHDQPSQPRYQRKSRVRVIYEKTVFFKTSQGLLSKRMCVSKSRTTPG